MLTNEQIKKYAEIIHASESVFDARIAVEYDLGHEITKEELEQIMNYANNSGEIVQNEPSRRNYMVASAKSADTSPAYDKTIRIKELADHLVDTYCRKNKDYGDSFGISVNKYGIIAALTRMSDKWNRLENLILTLDQRRNVEDESVLDTLLDMATYALMTYIEIEERK